jgi:TM2 domain-containing membrane protein YozV
MSPLSRGIALVLALAGGVFGLHRFYVGRRASGVAMICTLGGVGIWWLYDVITLAAGDFRDAAGRRLRRWQADDELSGTADGVAGRVDRLEREVAELAERLDFAERLLAQRGGRDRLPSA